MDGNITIYTLAKELSMTPSMVSRAFNPEAKIAPEKRRAVLEAAEKYGFSPNKLASRLSMKTVRIGIIIVYKARHVKDALLRGFKDAFVALKDYKLEYTVTEISAAEKSAHLCREELFALAECDGVILSGFGSTLCKELICDFARVNPNIVFVQNVCEDAPYLFSSKHDEALSASLAAQLLYERLYYSKRKNVFIFTGDRTSSVHNRIFSTFQDVAPTLGLCIVGDYDMKDSDDTLKGDIEAIFKRYGDKIDGIYISSGNSRVLCEYIHENRIPVSVLCSDVTDYVAAYIRNGTVFATLCQNLEKQAKVAFEELSAFILKKKTAEKTIYTEILPIFKANLELYIDK